MSLQYEPSSEPLHISAKRTRSAHPTPRVQNSQGQILALAFRPHSLDSGLTGGAGAGRAAGWWANAGNVLGETSFDSKIPTVYPTTGRAAGCGRGGRPCGVVHLVAGVNSWCQTHSLRVSDTRRVLHTLSRPLRKCRIQVEQKGENVAEGPAVDRWDRLDQP